MTKAPKPRSRVKASVKAIIRTKARAVGEVEVEGDRIRISRV
jgi:hypothetical protein